MPFKLLSFALTTLMVGLFPPSLISQAYLLHEVRFSGAPAYSQSELQAFIGLKPGSLATRQQLDDATQKLTDTGLFEEVTFTGNDKGVAFVLKPAAAQTARPIAFANFVWWSDEELKQALKASVPLFQPEAVPNEGSIATSVCAALTAILAGKDIGGAAVSSHLAGSGPGGRVEFAIDSPPVMVRSLTLTDASVAMRPKLEPIVHDMAGMAWNEAGTYGDVAGRVTSLYRNNGYRDVAVARQEHSPPAVTPRGIELDVTSAILEGAQYRVAQIGWAGTDVLSSADFTKRAKLKAGDVDSQDALLASLQVIRSAYGTKGYLDVDVVAPPSVDSGAHAVTYAVLVTPGPQYHFHSVRWPSLNPEQAKTFDASWQMKPGDVYDDSYLTRFLLQKGMLGRSDIKVTTTLNKDLSTRMVDLIVNSVSKTAPTGH